VFVDATGGVDPLDVGKFREVGGVRVLLRHAGAGDGWNDHLQRIRFTLAELGPEGVVDLPDMIGGRENTIIQVAQPYVHERRGQHAEDHQRRDDDEHGAAHDAPCSL